MLCVSWLVAFDAASGERLREVQGADHHLGYTMTNAPLVLDGMVVDGVARGRNRHPRPAGGVLHRGRKRLWPFEAAKPAAAMQPGAAVAR
jgi:hypothetical protein